MSILVRIKSVKIYKLQCAEKALTSAIAKVKLKRQDVEKAEKTLATYIDWRVKEEERLFNEAFEKCLNAKGLDDLRHIIGVMRSKDAFLNKKILDAQQNVDLAIEEKNACQQRVIQAEKILEKYDMLVKREAEKMRKNREKEEEYALEEFVSMRFSGGSS